LYRKIPKTKNIFMVFRKNLARAKFRISSPFAAARSARAKTGRLTRAAAPAEKMNTAALLRDHDSLSRCAPATAREHYNASLNLRQLLK
jgi:hypothetical protein